MTWTDEARQKAAAAKAAKKKERETPDLSPAEVAQRTLAVQARWAAERGSEEEVKQYFRQHVSIEDGLQLLARMRENCKHASLTLNARISADNNKDRCLFCGGPKKDNKQWALVRPYTDLTTQLPLKHFFCSIECVALMNRRNQGVYGVQDRGMTQDMNPQFHPKELSNRPEAEEKAIATTKNGDR